MLSEARLSCRPYNRSQRFHYLPEWIRTVADASTNSNDAASKLDSDILTHDKGEFIFSLVRDPSHAIERIELAFGFKLGFTKYLDKAKELE